MANFEMSMGNMYFGDFKGAVKHYTKKYGVKPVAIFCNKDEFLNVSLPRIVTSRWPKNHFVLTHIIKEK